MVRRGFTIVELIIIIAIMGILLVLAVVNVRGTQVSARDSERKSDVEAISLALENFYKNDFRQVGSVSGRYPSTGLIPIVPSVLHELDPKSYSAPGSETSSLIAATNAAQSTSTITPQPTINEYVYQPLAHNGTTWVLCDSGAMECRKYNIYFRLEATNEVMMVTSKNQ